MSADEPLRGPLFETYVAHSARRAARGALACCPLGFWNMQGRHEVDS